ncbi:MCE family protein [Aeromicrobium sp. Leaf350]|uniref:MCE family protein n=1 Tax=Aeromicrobium sp. Leaf350 TaxID=2876565 RepID=UPI001E42FC2C|nr:MCE family protein [Aeromicrobium sp. Leaf350]
MSRLGNTLATAGVLGALAAGLAGCGTTAADLPLPGSSMPGETYRITATFDDALNLAQGAPVKVDGVSIGRVDSISVKDLKAVVEMEIDDDTEIGTGADFRLRSTTALGELFVDVVDDPADTEVLADGDEVAPELASAAPTVEDTLSAASLFINGGGVGQIQTIVDETNLMIGGREDTLRDVLQRVASTAGAVTDLSGDIDAALSSISAASQVLADRQATIDRALTEIAPAAEVLDANTASLVDLLASIDTLGQVVVPTIEQTGDDIAAIVAQSGPVFEQVASIEPRIEEGVTQILAFVAGLQTGVPGSFLNTHLIFQGSLSIGDLTLVAPSTEGAPTPDVAPNAVQDLTQLPLISNLTGLLPTAPAAGAPASGGAGLQDLLGVLTGGSR